MKSLLTRPQRNFLVIVKVRIKDQRSVTIPVSLWALEEALGAIRDLAWLGGRMCRFWTRNRLDDKRISYISQMPILLAVETLGQILRDLRKLGRFRIVEVEDRNIRVYVDLF